VYVLKIRLLNEELARRAKIINCIAEVLATHSFSFEQITDTSNSYLFLFQLLRITKVSEYYICRSMPCSWVRLRTCHPFIPFRPLTTYLAKYHPSVQLREVKVIQLKN
jgi:hypothetical protein